MKEGVYMVVAALILWIADIIFQVVNYKKLADRVYSNCSLYGMFMAMVSSGLLTWLIAAGSKSSGGRHAATVNGVRISPDVYFNLEVFMTWVFLGAIMNLIAMGIAYLLTAKYRKK